MSEDLRIEPPHKHKYEKCGKIWSHSKTFVNHENNEQLHTCARCGETQYWVYYPEREEI